MRSEMLLENVVAVRLAGSVTTVATRMTVPLSPERVWERLALYEQIHGRLSLPLRLLIPTPSGLDAPPTRVGDEVRCRYRSGHLVKRVTHFDRARLYGFDVVEQALGVRGVRLRSGWYALRPLAGGGTEIEAGTRYESPWRPRWLFRRVERSVCRAFHHHVLSAVIRTDEFPGAATGG